MNRRRALPGAVATSDSGRHRAVLDAVDVSGQFGRGRHGNVPFARKHLGMPRSVFESCAFISQGDVFEVAKNAPTEIGDAVAALRTPGGETSRPRWRWTAWMRRSRRSAAIGPLRDYRRPA
jgi:hypothetical protein